MGIPFALGAGQFAAGVGQGFNQGRLMAIQQAYLKLQQQREQMLEQQMAFQHEQTQQNELAKPLEALADKFPRLAGTIGPALTGIRNPQGASYQPTLQDQAAPAPDPMLLERPEQQPVTGKAAVMPLVKNAYESASKTAQSEYDTELGMKRRHLENEDKMRQASLESAQAMREFMMYQRTHPAGTPGGPMVPLKGKDAQDVQTALDYYDAALSAKNFMDSDKLKKYGALQSLVSDAGGAIGGALGMSRGPFEDPEFNAARKWFMQRLYASETRAGGLRMAASPQMFENNKHVFLNPQYMNHDTMANVANNSLTAAQTTLDNYRQDLAARGMDTSIIDNHVPRLQSPDEILGKAVNPAAMDALRKATSGAAPNIGTAPVPQPLQTLRPIQ